MKKFFSNAVNAFKSAVQVFYPKICIGCGVIIAEDKWLCNECRQKIKRVPNENRCQKCGYPKKFCECRYFAYRFEGIVAPFYNDGIVKKSFYAYKFNHRIQYAKFFGREMAACVANGLSDRTFDAVCYVPTSVRHYRQRGYNQSKELAKVVAARLDLPLLTGVLSCRQKGRPQKELDSPERFLAARERFGYSKSVGYRNILLVDDIRTTGATLDACARQLLFAGAETVFCVTALMSEPWQGSNTSVWQKVLKKDGRPDIIKKERK